MKPFNIIVQLLFSSFHFLMKYIRRRTIMFYYNFKHTAIRLFFLELLPKPKAHACFVGETCQLTDLKPSSSATAPCPSSRYSLRKVGSSGGSAARGAGRGSLEATFIFFLALPDQFHRVLVLVIILKGKLWH